MEIRTFTVLAQDPSFRKASGGALTARVELSVEHLSPGPTGARVRVLDHDALGNRLIVARQDELDVDHFEGVDAVDMLVADMQFHQQNVFAIVMATLGSFERALGRRVSWSLPDGRHQLLVVPHAFPEANACYAPDQGALLFGYFPDDDDHTIYSCLSHDIVAHETCHALLHGLRPQFLLPSSVDQAAFHEGFADLISLLSVFSQREVVRYLLELDLRDVLDRQVELEVEELTVRRLQSLVLFKLAEQMGAAIHGGRAAALRASTEIEVPRRWLEDGRYHAPHLRGEVLVAAVLNAFIEIWLERVRKKCGARVHIERLVDEGALTASHLRNVAIRAIDYTPPTDIEFGDYLSAMITADRELHPNDKYDYRGTLLESFERYGIEPASPSRTGMWEPPTRASELRYDNTHHAELRWSRDEAFRFLWENAELLGFNRDAETRVDAVQPVTRISVDGLILEETVITYSQMIRARAGDVESLTRCTQDSNIALIDELPDDLEIVLCGGGTLIFDDYGRLKFNIGNGFDSPRQFRRLAHLWDSNHYAEDRETSNDIARVHRLRVKRAGGSS